MGELVVSGVMLGAIYSLVSVGLTLVFGVLRLINFAHGHFLMVGMYLTYWLNHTLGLDPYVAVLVVTPALFLFGVVVERLLLESTIGGSSMTQTFVTLGLTVVLQNLALLLFTADYRSVQSVASTAVVHALGTRVSVPRVVIFGTTLAVGIALHLFLKRAYFGKAIRATVENPRAAMVMGVNVKRVYLVTFGIGSALVGLAGALLMPIYYVFPRVGLDFVLVAFVVSVLGGLGSLPGAMLAGFAIGVIETVSGFFIGTAWKQAVYFMLFLLVLIVRPAGLFGIRGAEEIGLK